MVIACRRAQNVSGLVYSELRNGTASAALSSLCIYGIAMPDVSIGGQHGRHGVRTVRRVLDMRL